MVRITLIGLLIAGVTPIALADATVLSNKQSLSSKISLSKVCNSPLICPKTSNIDLKQPKLTPTPVETISKIFFSGSILPQCIDKFYNSTNIPTRIILDSLEAIPAFNECTLPWQINYQQTIASSQLVEDDHNYPQFDKSKFPQLSRSSLITPFPQQDSTFVPDKSQFAHPAPQTKSIASPFGWRKRPLSNQLQFHAGIDYRAPLGSPVVAVDQGIVTKVVSGCIDFGNIYCGGQLGNWVEVDHGKGAIAIYGHLKNNSIKVEEGMKIRKNQEIAQVGSSGWSTGAHLDFRVQINGQQIDPTKFLVFN
ncbi:peptidase M23B [Chondrocystis sp. NIES-4102]|nr:peptidase M23B [Chondrocystis sp. NIES-4102]